MNKQMLTAHPVLSAVIQWTFFVFISNCFVFTLSRHVMNPTRNSFPGQDYNKGDVHHCEHLLCPQETNTPLDIKDNVTEGHIINSISRVRKPNHPSLLCSCEYSNPLPVCLCMHCQSNLSGCCVNFRCRCFLTRRSSSMPK